MNSLVCVGGQELYSTLAHRAGGQAIFLIRSCSFGVTSQTERHTLRSKCCAAIFPFPVWRNYRFCFDIQLSLTYKWVFNVGQEKEGSL